MKTRGKLSRERIVQLALSLLDSAGTEGFSMRKLAAQLEVDPMAIYYHFANKSDLLHAVMQSMMEKCEVPEPSGNWRTDIRNLCQGLRRMAKKHPGAFCIYETYDQWLPAEHRLHEAFHSTLLQAGFSRKSAVRAVRVLLIYAEAFAVDEISGWLDPADQAELAESLQSGPYPTLSSLIKEIGTVDADSEFEFGLDVLISGLESEIRET
ncbi:MAG: TetR/AcrR family transcriptional regulator C-terminal domain-containing protein [Pseudomonadota bacterium]